MVNSFAFDPSMLDRELLSAALKQSQFDTTQKFQNFQNKNTIS